MQSLQVDMTNMAPKDDKHINTASEDNRDAGEATTLKYLCMNIVKNKKKIQLKKLRE